MGARSSLVNESWSQDLPVGRSKKKMTKSRFLPISIPPDPDGPFSSGAGVYTLWIKDHSRNIVSYPRIQAFES